MTIGNSSADIFSAGFFAGFFAASGTGGFGAGGSNRGCGGPTAAEDSGSGGSQPPAEAGAAGFTGSVSLSRQCPEGSRHPVPSTTASGWPGRRVVRW